MQSMQPLTRVSRQAPRCLSRRAQTCLFHNSTDLHSGHSRWSKIKHDKGANDAAKNKQRSIFAQEIATASRLFGPDPSSNPRLLSLITAAKRSGFAKLSIESAILRGQGKSASGTALEPITIEAILPQNIACIIECEAESRLRSIAEVKHAVKEAGGNATSCSYLFSKKGRVVLEGRLTGGTEHGEVEERGKVDVEEVFEAALEVGALDVEEDGEEGRVVVFTEPADTKATGEKLSASLGLDVVASEIFWDANEDTVVEVGSETVVTDLLTFVDGLEAKEGGGVVGIYLNVKKGEAVEEGAWAELMDRLSG